MANAATVISFQNQLALKVEHRNIRSVNFRIIQQTFHRHQMTIALAQDQIHFQLPIMTHFQQLQRQIVQTYLSHRHLHQHHQRIPERRNYPLIQMKMKVIIRHHLHLFFQLLRIHQLLNQRKSAQGIRSKQRKLRIICYPVHQVLRHTIRLNFLILMKINQVA